MKHLSIGQVAKLKNTSIKSLRYYDEIGILKPTHVNPKTGYRYYAEDQLPILDAISLYLTIDLPLKDIKNYIVSDRLLVENFLADANKTAQKKILAIQESLDQFQSFFCKKEGFPTTPNSIFTSLFTSENRMEERTLLVLPIQDNASTVDYNKYIIRLFVLAQSLNLNAFYPSGKLCHYKNGTQQNYIFIQIELNKEDMHNEYLQNDHIITLPSGSYLCHKVSKSAFDEYWPQLSGKFNHDEELIFIETDLIDSNQNNDNFKYELQLTLNSIIT